MLYGGQVDDSSNHNFVLTAQEALGVDSKLDDGKPSYGKLVAGQWDSCTDATSETDTASPTYQLGSNNKICILFYRQFIR